MYLITLIAIFLSALLMTASGSLFPNAPYVTTLNEKTFDAFVSQQPSVVLFYLRNCGGCMSYAPIYENISRLIATWQWATKLAAIDCADEGSFSLVKSKTDVTYFPSLRFYAKGGKAYDFVLTKNISEFRNSLAKNLVEVVELDSLLPLVLTNNNDSNSLVIQSNNAINNAMMILDLKPVIITTLTSVVNPELPNDAYSLNTGGGVPLLTGVNGQKMREYIRQHYTPKSNGDRTDPEKANVTMAPVYAADIVASLKILLFQDVSLKEVIKDADLSALKEFLAVATKYLPLRGNYGQALNKIKSSVDQLSVIYPKTWTTILKNSQFPETKVDFIGCKGSKSQYRGYPCGLWIMFHAMTVQKFLTGGDLSIAHALNRFVPRFFSCVYCAFDFARLSSNARRPGEPIWPERNETPPFALDSPDPSTLPARPTSVREEVLYLHEAHNIINKRVSKRPTEDPQAPKAVFPSPEQCPACWSATALAQRKTDDLSVVPDRTEEVLRFLVNHYQPTSWNWDQITDEGQEPSPTEFPPPLPVYTADMIASLKTVLFQDVALKDVIQGDDMSALQEFLNVVTKYLPLEETYNLALSRLKSKVDLLTSLTSAEWVNLLHEVQFPTVVINYIACRGSQPQFRGYPCGLWIIFHAMTVEQYLSRDEFDQSSSVIHAMNRFIPRFFSCEPCAFHFARLSSNVRHPGEPIWPTRAVDPPFPLHTPDPSTVPAAPTSLREQVLFLSDAHNIVNKRIARSPSEDPQAPKAVFPSPHQCPVCWSAKALEQRESDHLSVLPDKRDELMAFLVHHYRSSSWKWVGLPVSFQSLTRHVEDVSQFTTGDMLMACGLSVACTLLLATLVFYLFCRRKHGTSRPLRA